MEMYNGIVCVTFNDLLSTDGGEAVMKIGTLKSMISRNKELCITKSKGQTNYARIDYYALPEKWRARFEAKYGDPRELLEKSREQDRLGMVMDARARDFYTNYTYYLKGEKKGLEGKFIEEYTLNATVLSRLGKSYNDRIAYRKARGGNVRDVWKTIFKESEELKTIYSHTLPSSKPRLRAKLREFEAEGYVALISGKMGNSNTRILTPDAVEYIIALKRSSTPVYNNRQIFEEFNRVAPDNGWKQLKSVDYITKILSQPETEQMWYDAVHGELKSNQRYSRKNQTEMASKRDALWYGDGTRLNLYYRSYEQGRGWVVKTMQVYEVIDAYSEVLLGYHISESEDYEAQYNAIRMAIQVSDCRPFEFVHDNQGGHKKIGSWLDKIAHVHRPTAPYSGQSKTIESVFGRFQAEVLHRDWRFTGQNITAKRASSRPNLERIKANIDKLYTLDELRAAYYAAREEWNNGKHHATGLPRMAMYKSSTNERTHPVTVNEMVDMFWLTTKRASAYTASGITIQINKKQYSYEVMAAPGTPDHEFLRNNFGRKFFVKYDPADMMSVRLYVQEANGEMRFVRVAEPYIKIHRAIQDQQPGEREFIDANIRANRQDRIERQIAARTIERKHGMSMEEQGLRRPSMAGMTNAKKAELEIEREVRRRTRKAGMDKKWLEPGRITKEISNILYNELPGEISLDQHKVAGKL